ncbi:hypothetical protein [Bacillus dakarensis]|uniref:hypothetical protein n=1 Tax=Robertmurraya dakarensis TaxID=1926278 RepID=UPI0009811B3A|nr:hypothetical protein [Bacillus dakarensis]
MEISINLLPQNNSRKEKRSVYLVPVLGIVTALGTASFLIYQYFDTKNTVEVLSETIAAQTASRDESLTQYREETAGVTEFNFTDKYKHLHQFLNNLYENTIELQGEVYKLLPASAEVNTYTYSNNGDLFMTVTFDSKGDSALFLHRLLQAEFVIGAVLESISAEEEEVAYEAQYTIKLNTIAGEKE